MDKIKIHLVVKKDFMFEYELGIPENFNWFIISRYNKTKNNYETDHLIYNGNKFLLYGYYFKENQKITKYYDEYQNNRVEKEMLIDLLNCLGINWFSLKLLDKLDFETKYLKRKYWKQYYFNYNVNYILKENISKDHEYKKI